MNLEPKDDVLNLFADATRRWFSAAFAEPTEVQRRGWPVIAARRHSLLLAPTGSGKTLAAFLWAIDALSRQGARAREQAGVQVLYVSPLKALVYDIERNLQAPLSGLRAAAGSGSPLPRVAVRTGDTSQRDRRLQSRDPAEILVTTPESLYLILGAAQRETLRSVQTVIVDEVHALAPTKRGAHLALSLERLAALTDREPQRIGLSATARPISEVARYLGGDRPVEVVDASGAPHLSMQISVPLRDMTQPALGGLSPQIEGARGGLSPQIEGARGGLSPQIEEDLDLGDELDWDPRGAGPGDPRGPEGTLLGELHVSEPERSTSIWPALHGPLLEAVRAHRSTIIFVNSRGLCERLCQRLNELAEEELLRSHHGSLAHDQRKQIEEALKAGEIRGIVATSSLELGIDMGTVDLVVLVESPGAVARGLQRVGRAGHQVGAISKGLVLPKHRGDLLEATVVVGQMLAGEIEPLKLPQNPLDVLAQQIVAACAQDDWEVEPLGALVRRAANYAQLSDDVLRGVLDMLAGRYPSTEFADLKPRLVWDRDADRLTARRGAKSIAAVSGGTIPDRGLYGVHLGADGPRLGELDEEMVHETRPGQTFTLGASTWRVEQITRDRVLVSPAPGEPGKLPFWHGDRPGRPIELGRAVGGFVRELEAVAREGDEAAEAWLRARCPLDELAAINLLSYVREQQEATGTLPTDRAITVEQFRDELGDWRVCILSPFGARVHAPWALALERSLSAGAGFEVQTLYSDDGIVLRFADAEELPGLDQLLPDPDEIEDLLVEQLASSALFAAQFRENAARALLLPRRRPGKRVPLWAQRLKAQNLLAVAQQYPSFPIVLETYRACLQDVFDLPALTELLRAAQRRELRVDQVETKSASPFARSLVFAYVAAYMYEGDAPLAERRAQALSLDRQMLRELLGAEELRDLLDAEVVGAVEDELQLRAADYRARNKEGLADVLRRLGDLSPPELEARCLEPQAVASWAEELVGERRALWLRIGGEQRLVAIEDTALYRDALGTMPPGGVPEVFLEPVEAPLEALLRRFARTHGPFTTEQLADRYGALPAQLAPVLEALELRELLLGGDFRPGGSEREWCDPEVLRRLRRRTLAKLRDEVAPVEHAVLGRFLPGWHGVAPALASNGAPPRRASGEARLDAALAQLEGLPLSFRELEGVLLPARVDGFRPAMLDQLGAMGQLVWIGAGALGSDDGRVALYRRERVPWLHGPPEVDHEALSAPQRALLAQLERGGASFFTELCMACPELPQREVAEELWQLVWSGLVTNDTFLPLRALRQPARARGRRASPAAAGRWSLVTNLLGPEQARPSATEQAHARALLLLERHGLVTREVAQAEGLAGGFSAIYPVLRAMEEAGKIRRGYFVEGLGGAQFAHTGAVERLRARRDLGVEAEVVKLSAVDPANPYGATLPWPRCSGGDDVSSPRRVPGASVLLVDGALVLYLDRGARRALTFGLEQLSPTAARTAAGDERVEHARRAIDALKPLAATRRGRYLRIETLDGVPARQSPLAPLFEQRGFNHDLKGLVFEARLGAR
jgi:ATP-dependent Lhr-like helicase